MPGALLSVKDVARYLSVSDRTVETIIAEGKLVPIWIRGARRFTPEAVDAFVRACPGGKTNRRRKRQPHKHR